VANLNFKVTSDDFLSASKQFDVVPVHAVIDSISIRPIDAFKTLRLQGEPAFIFESESPEAGASRYAYVCPNVEQVVRTGENESLGDTNPITALRQQFKARTVAPVSDLPELVTGAFGYIAYEAIKHFEPSIGELPADPTDSPTSALLSPAELLVFDRALDQLNIIVFATRGQTLESAETRISNICETLESAPDTGCNPNNIDHSYDDQPVQPLHTTTAQHQHQYRDMVSKARTAIINGELIQVVLGQRVETSTQAEAVDIYEHLSIMNPSPYMYMLDLGDIQLIGASPELMLRTTNGKAAVHPIAGTRPRGKTAEEDLQYEAELLSNEKELAEHVMLVDLARNDLGRVSKPGTVNVTSFKRIERYSHVMHLVSRVVGELANDKDGIDAFEAGFPIGTLSGAPKIRSIQLIAELEKEGRGPYCGGIGWFAPNGDVDTGTIIRSIVLRNGTAHVQGGAGIVFDSDPEAEYLESLQKAKAPLLAISRAEITAETTQHHHWRSNENISPETPHTATITAE
jgi:anthranilate synthase component I